MVWQKCHPLVLKRSKYIFFDLIRQCIYLKLEKPSGSEIESPIHKRLTIDLLEGMAKSPPPGPDRVKFKPTISV